jgi:hypothetical protein
MFDSLLKPNYHGDTGTATLLALAFISSSALLAASRPFEYLFPLVVVCSAVCVMAWVSWRRSSQLVIRSITSQSAEWK